MAHPLDGGNKKKIQCTVYPGTWPFASQYRRWSDGSVVVVFGGGLVGRGDWVP